MRIRQTALARAAVVGLLLATMLVPCQAGDAPATPAQYRRPSEQTLLALPEWYLTVGTDEYGRFIATQSPGEFPYLPAIGQFWSSYRTAAQMPDRVTHRAATGLAGAGKTVEYLAKAAYETTIGRLTEATCSHGPTEEDRLAAQVARDYGSFVRTAPWYAFDYGARLRALWRETAWFGDDMLRKWERKLVLSLEFGMKAAAGWTVSQAMRLGPKETERAETAIVLDRLPAQGARMPFLQGVNRLPDGGVMILVPRHDGFREAMTALAAAGANFAEIAGNRSGILVSVVAPQAWHPQDDKVTVLFEAPVLVSPETKRVALLTPVDNLAPTLRTLAANSVAVERVFDF